MERSDRRHSAHYPQGEKTERRRRSHSRNRSSLSHLTVVSQSIDESSSDRLRQPSVESVRRPHSARPEILDEFETLVIKRGGFLTLTPINPFPFDTLFDWSIFWHFFVILDQIDESYQILKQGKALRLVQTGEDVREGKSAKKSIADPIFWKSLFMKRGSIVPEEGLGKRPKKGLFRGLIGVGCYILNPLPYVWLKVSPRTRGTWSNYWYKTEHAIIVEFIKNIFIDYN